MIQLIWWKKERNESEKKKKKNKEKLHTSDNFKKFSWRSGEKKVVTDLNDFFFWNLSHDWIWNKSFFDFEKISNNLKKKKK